MASHKTLKGVVRNLAESFASLTNYCQGDYVMGHIVSTAWQTRARELRVDLLSGQVYPSPLVVPPVRESIRHYVQWFPKLVLSSRSDMKFVSSAELLVTVDPDTIRPYGTSGLQESPFTCTVRILDDHGKQYSHTVSNWWYPEEAPSLQ